MRVLLTRPQPESQHLASQLEKLGHSVLIEPMLRIEELPGEPPSTHQVQAILLTSGNGARAAAKRVAQKEVPVIAIGAATAQAANAAGFTFVTQSPGDDAKALATYIGSSLNPKAGKLLHITGTHSAFDLKTTLSNAGFELDVVIGYDAVAAESLSQKLLEELDGAKISAALFYSPRTAAIFAKLVQLAERTGSIQAVSALTLSQNVANSLNPLIFRKVLVAKSATGDAMLDLLKTL